MAVRTFGINGSSETAASYRLATGGLWVPASALNVRTGVTSVPTLTGTGSFTCTISPFSCAIDGTSNSLQGGYPAALDTAAAVTVDTASTQARIDLISLQIQDNDYDGSGQHQGVVVYTAGTPGSGTAPNTPANAIPLFTVPVAANASSANFAGATAVFPFTAAAGGIVPVRNSGDQPAVINGVQYRHRLDVTATATGASPLESSTNGTTWVPVSNPNGAYGAWTGLTPSASFIASVLCQYRTAPGGRIELRGRMTVSGSVASGTQIVSGLPAPASNRLMQMASNGVSCAFNLLATTTAALTSSASALADGTMVGLDGLSYTL